jgi:hypothetical protein
LIDLIVSVNHAPGLQGWRGALALRPGCRPTRPSNKSGGGSPPRVIPTQLECTTTGSRTTLEAGNRRHTRQMRQMLLFRLVSCCERAKQHSCLARTIHSASPGKCPARALNSEAPDTADSISPADSLSDPVNAVPVLHHCGGGFPGLDFLSPRDIPWRMFLV